MENITNQNLDFIFFAEGLSEHLYIGKVRQFHKLIQPKLSDNSFKKIFTVFPT